MVEWEGFVAINKTLPKWKEYFIQAYELREASGITAGGAGYHGAENAFNDDVTLDKSLAQLQVANNATIQGVQSNISAVTNETRELRAALVATQQQLTNLMAGNGTVSTEWPAIQPPVQPTQYVAIQPVQYVAPSQYTAQSYQGPPLHYAAPSYQHPSYTQSSSSPRT